MLAFDVVPNRCQVCGIRLAMKDVRDATARVLDSTTLSDVLRRVEGKVRGVPFSYSI